MNFPLKAKYKREESRLYFSGDFKDDEVVEFYYHSEKYNSKVLGYAYYRSVNEKSKVNLVNVKDLIDMKLL